MKFLNMNTMKIDTMIVKLKGFTSKEIGEYKDFAFRCEKKDRDYVLL